MAKVALNKSSLSAEKKRQRSFEKYLPSLELKQKQLLTERKKHEQLLVNQQAKRKAIEDKVYSRLPMLAVENIELKGLVTVEVCDLVEENMLGTTLPSLKTLRFKRCHYSYLARPHWVDEVCTALEQVLRLRIEEELLEQRLQLIREAVQTITQRVNLFSKVLLPECDTHIKRIGQFLADQDRAAVIRAKLAKNRHRPAEPGELAS